MTQETTQGTTPGSGPIPHWPGRMVSVGDHEVFVRGAPAPDHAEPALCVHGLEGSSRNWTDLTLMQPGITQINDIQSFGGSTGINNVGTPGYQGVLYSTNGGTDRSRPIVRRSPRRWIAGVARSRRSSTATPRARRR